MMITPAKWLIKDRLIYAYAEGTTTIPELREHSQHVIALLDEGTRPIHMLLENTPNYRPETIDLRSGLDSLRFVYHPSLGWAVHAMQGNHGMRLVARLISRFARVSYQTVETRQEALDFLHTVDDTLDWSQLDASVFQPTNLNNHQKSVSKP